MSAPAVREQLCGRISLYTLIGSKLIRDQETQLGNTTCSNSACPAALQLNGVRQTIEW